MRISCFSSSTGRTVDHEDEAPRSVAIRKRTPLRQGTGSSTSSRASFNTTLPPPLPKTESDPKIEALMMPMPLEARPSRCLRLSQPKTYSAIIDSMKATKGCRDWRSFACFPDDDVDENISAKTEAAKRVKLTEAKCVRQAALAVKYRRTHGSSDASDASSTNSDMAGWQC